MFDRRRGDHVDGVLHGGGGGKERTQLRLRFVGELRHLHAVLAHGVGRHDARPPGIRDDRHAVALRNRARGENLGRGEKLLKREFADDARLAKERVGRLVGAGERTRVGGSGARARGRTPGLQGENGLFLRDAASKEAEVRRILNRLHVEENLLDVLFVLPVFQRRLGVDVRLVADRDELRKAEVEVLEDVEDAAAERARLRDKADAAALGKAFGKAPVEPHVGVRIDDAEAVGPHRAHAVAADAFEKFLFEGRPFGSGFLEARRDDAQPPDALGVAFVDGGENKVAVDDDDREIHVARNFADRTVHRAPFDDAALRIDRIDFSPEAVLGQTLHQVRSDGVCARGGADHGDGAGLHDVVQNAHGVLSVRNG